MNGIRLGLYDTTKQKFSQLTGLSKSNMLVGFVSGALTGIVGTYTSYY